MSLKKEGKVFDLLKMVSYVSKNFEGKHHPSITLYKQFTRLEQRKEMNI